MPELAPRQLILTLYGLYARDEHNWLSVGSVVKLLGDLGVDSAGVRSSISRLKRRGVLNAMKIDKTAGYALSDDILEILREGDVRIFDRHRSAVADGFVLVAYSIPESEREKRHQLRTALSQMGLGSASPGLWIGPAALLDETVRALRRLGLDAYADVFVAQYDSFGALRERVGAWWDLDAIDSEYAAFIDQFGDAARRWKSASDVARAAFTTYVPMLTVWRRLPYRDPGLPLEVLPANWSGVKAADLFHDLDALLRTPAREHAMTTIHS